MGKISDYEIRDRLGRGAYGEVFKVKNKKDNKIMVLKQINISRMSKRARMEAENEVKI